MVAKKSNQPFFSIVIPTLNEEKYVPLLLNDLVNQTFQDFEVVHVDGKSEDITMSVAKEAAKHLAFKQISTPVQNVSYQRNKGGQKAAGEWVLFIDADVRLNQFFLEDLRAQMSFIPSGSIFTTWLSPDENQAITQTVSQGINLAYEFYRIIGKPAAIGAFIGAHYSVLEHVQFDETQKVMEDALFIEAAAQHGHPFIIFRYPRFTFSFRRLRKEGTLKLAKQVVLMNLRYIQGKTFEEDNHGYVMHGGEYYTTQSPSIFWGMEQYLRAASKKQLAQTRRLLDSIKELEF